MRGHLQLPRTRRPTSALLKWRLKKVTDYVEAHLADHITVGDLAVTVGLTRSHFTAQFRVATGVCPHEYILRRRVERAQQLMRNRKRPLVDIALSVGFQTQAHFTTVFRRFTEQTPDRWRRAIPETPSQDIEAEGPIEPQAAQSSGQCTSAASSRATISGVERCPEESEEPVMTKPHRHMPTPPIPVAARHPISAERA
jgi:AraC-like DNA-binding protein